MTIKIEKQVNLFRPALVKCSCAHEYIAQTSASGHAVCAQEIIDRVKAELEFSSSDCGAQRHFFCRVLKRFFQEPMSKRSRNTLSELGASGACSPQRGSSAAQP